ncbi:MAG: hypothetical protein ACJ8KA_03385, partial [Sulfurifustis sp.]
MSSASRLDLCGARPKRHAPGGKVNPPKGNFIDIDGVRLHYIERGAMRFAYCTLLVAQMQDPI